MGSSKVNCVVYLCVTLINHSFHSNVVYIMQYQLKIKVTNKN